jgi:transposase, IS5 family
LQRVPDKTTLLRWAATIRPETVQTLLDRAAVLAQQATVTRARKLRVDSTCVQTLIHPPTESGVLGDSVRVLTRLILRVKPLLAEAQAPLASVRDAFRSRVRSARVVLQPLHRVRQGSQTRQPEQYGGRRGRSAACAVDAGAGDHRTDGASGAARTCGPAGTMACRCSDPPPTRAPLGGRLLAQFDRFLPLVQQGMQQAQARVLDGQPVPSLAKVLSLFDPHTRVVTRRTLGAPVAFGR